MSPLDCLLSLDLDERVERVAADIESEQDRYRDIEPHALATALGVPQPEYPVGWEFVRYAEILPIEARAKEVVPPSELAYFIEAEVSEQRVKEILEQFERVDGEDDPDFSFLTMEERSLIEQKAAEADLEANSLNGVSCLAFFSVQSRSGSVLKFEASIEDDGTCIDLRTPYDEKDGAFSDLSNCVLDEW